jgi:hypothetical protein
MSDVNETLLNNYEEAIDMGMKPSKAMEWAKEKTYGYVDHNKKNESFRFKFFKGEEK